LRANAAASWLVRFPILAVAMIAAEILRSSSMPLCNRLLFSVLIITVEKVT